MVVLATKVYVQGDARERSLSSLRSLVENDVGELDVTVDVGVRHDDFPSVTVDGPDAVAARNLLRERWGEITGSLSAGDTGVGTLESWDEGGFVLDAGRPVRIARDAIGLGPGSPLQIRERFGLVQHLPMTFVVEDVHESIADETSPGTVGEVPLAARLSDDERDRLFEWTRGNGRLNVNSATRGEVRATLNRAGHARDYVTIERLGLLEQSVICTDDTDPPGLLASVGEYLQSELRCVVT